MIVTSNYLLARKVHKEIDHWVNGSIQSLRILMLFYYKGVRFDDLKRLFSVFHGCIS